MDEIELFTALRPTPGPNCLASVNALALGSPAPCRESGARASVGHPGRRLGGLNSPTRTVFTVGGAALAVGGATVLAAVLPTVLSAGQSGSLITSAWAVQPRKDGTVKVTIKDASDPAGLQRALRAAGIRAVVVSPREITRKDPQGGWVTHPVCTYPTAGPLFAPAAVQRAVVTVPRPATGSVRSPRVIAFIHPAAMPSGSVLFISDTFSALPNGSRSLSVTKPAVLKGHKLPQCRSNEPPMPVPSTSPTPGSHHARHPAGYRPTPAPIPSGRPTTSPTPTPIPSGRPTTSPTPIPIPSRRPTKSPTPIPSASPKPSAPDEPVAGSEWQLAPMEYRGGSTAIFITWDEGEGGSSNKCATSKSNVGCRIAAIVISHPIYDAFPWRVVGLWLHNTEKLHDQAGLLAGGPAN